MKIEHKAFPFLTASVDLVQGLFEGYASTFGVVDEYDDVVEPGAFLKTIQEMGQRVKICWQHQWDNPIGRPVLMEEHGRERLPATLLARAPEATGGLFVQGQISPTTQGTDALILLRDGVVDELSIGYDPIKTDYSERDGKARLRHLREIRLWEFSPVTWGANHAAVITGVKAVVPFQDLGLAEEGRAWDAAAARKRVQAWAGGDEWSPEKYRQAFLWYDDEAEDLLGSYKLPIADVIKGALTAVPRGIFAAAARLEGTDISAGDVEKCRNHLARYYKEMDRQPPWERDEAGLAVDLELLLSQPGGIERLAATLRGLRAAEPGRVASLTARARVLEMQLRLAGLAGGIQ